MRCCPEVTMHPVTTYHSRVRVIFCGAVGSIQERDLSTAHYLIRLEQKRMGAHFSAAQHFTAEMVFMEPQYVSSKFRTEFLKSFRGLRNSAMNKLGVGESECFLDLIC